MLKEQKCEVMSRGLSQSLFSVRIPCEPTPRKEGSRRDLSRKTALKQKWPHKGSMVELENSKLWQEALRKRAQDWQGLAHHR